MLFCNQKCSAANLRVCSSKNKMMPQLPVSHLIMLAVDIQLVRFLAFLCTESQLRNAKSTVRQRLFSRRAERVGGGGPLLKLHVMYMYIWSLVVWSGVASGLNTWGKLQQLEERASSPLRPLVDCRNLLAFFKTLHEFMWEHSPWPSHCHPAQLMVLHCLIPKDSAWHLHSFLPHAAEPWHVWGRWRDGNGLSVTEGHSLDVCSWALLEACIQHNWNKHVKLSGTALISLLLEVLSSSL